MSAHLYVSDFALTLPRLPTHIHTHTHSHMERCSFNDIGVFVCKTQKTRPVPFHLPQSSIDHMTGTRDHYDYLLMLSASLGNGSRGCRGREAGGGQASRNAWISHYYLRTTQSMPRKRCRCHVHTYTHTIVHMVRLEICTTHGPGNAKAKAKAKRPRLQAAVATS